MPSFPGFSVGDTPGAGTFYDFHTRLWMADKNNLSAPVPPPKEKPQNRVKKAPSVEKVTVKELFEQFELHPPEDMAPYKRLYDIFKVLFLDHPVQSGLVDLLNLSLAGDGTPAYTAARERKKRTCLFSLSLTPLPDMIPLVFFITGFPWNSFCRRRMSQNCSWTPHMMPCLTTNTAVIMGAPLLLT